MSLQLSSRATDYIRTVPGESGHFSRSEIDELFRSKGFRISEMAAAAIEIFGGKKMLTVYDRIFWFGIFEPDSIETFIVSKSESSWISICETRYPGTVYLRDDGALFFEDDSPSLWFNSIAKLIETQASIAECIGDCVDFCERRVIDVDSVESFARRLSLRIDEPTLDRSVVLKGNGRVAVLHDASRQKSGILLAAQDSAELSRMIDCLS